tara:strand:- start:667 stop:1626 length:960 start_codon:yes stop_codon:yes gene_type:complete
MVGKLTNDHEMSCSILATAAGLNPWKSRIDLLGEMILAKRGENIRKEQTAIMSRGDTLEPILLTTAGKELGLDKVQVDIDLARRHAHIPLQGSLDGLCWNEGKTIEENPDKGIYVLTDTKKIFVEGNGVMECKLTSAYPEDEPPAWRGPMQLQGLMDIESATYGVLVVCYQSIYWRYFVYPRNEEMVAEIHTLVKDMDRRVREEDFFPPESPKDASTVYPETNEQHIDLEDDALDFIDLYNHATKSIKHWQNVKEDAQVSLMGILQDNTTGSISTDETTYIVKWGMRNVKPKPSKIIPEEPGYSVRSNSISIKEVSNEN